MQDVRVLDVRPWDVSVHNICVRDFRGKEVCVPTVTAQFCVSLNGGCLGYLPAGSVSAR